MIETIGQSFRTLIYELAATDQAVVQLSIILVILVIVLDAISTLAQESRNKAGLSTPKEKANKESRSVKPEALDSVEYVSEIQGISGKPDAIILEEGVRIPVCRKPLAKKIRDRYVAQLLVYMRLIEEFEGKRPPHGYLILGANARRVKISNSLSRQQWLDSILLQMRLVAEKKESARPAPSPPKCSRCNVRHSCAHSLAKPKSPSKGKNKTAPLMPKHR